MIWTFNDGGRAAAGFKGEAGDCVCRAVAIASGRPYAEVYAALASGSGNERRSKGRTARNGVHVKRQWFKDYMKSLGFSWTPTMHIGSGCKVHLRVTELPPGPLVVQVSGHMCAVVDGKIHDTHDPSRDGTRCVYGYWTRRAGLGETARPDEPEATVTPMARSGGPAQTKSED